MRPGCRALRSPVPRSPAAGRPTGGRVLTPGARCRCRRCGARTDRPGLRPGSSSSDPARWETVAPDWATYVGQRYLFRITRDDGSLNYATDMFSREQCGEGDVDPGGAHYDGTPAELDGRPSCSEVIDPALVAAYPPVPGVPTQTEAEFSADEHPPARSVRTLVADLLIYARHE